MAEPAEQLLALKRVAADAGVHTLLLREPATLGWLTGARWHVPQTLGSACFDVVIANADTNPAVQIIVNAIEAPRLADTELTELDVHWTVLPWTQSRAEAWPSGTDVGVDRPLDATTDLSTAVRAARLVLTGAQTDRLEVLGRECAESTRIACESAGPAVSEYAVAAQVAAQLLQRGIDPICLFVAGKPRMATHRHPLPTMDLVGARAMVVVCGRRDGLVASVTRIVSFGRIPVTDRGRYTDLLAVEQAFLDASRPGATLGSAFEAGISAYTRHGFSDTEWTRHHQGGLTGFVPREVLGSPGETTILTERNVLAWNPSAAGWKVEDTVVLDAHGPRLLSHDGVWPSVEVGGRLRPDVLQL